MNNEHSIAIEYPDVETIRITITPVDSGGDTETEARTFPSGALLAPAGDIIRSVYSIPEILEDTETALLRFQEGQKRLWARPKDEDSILLDVTSVWQDGPLGTFPMKKVELCNAIVRAADSFYDQACGDSRSEVTDECDCTTLPVGIEDSRNRISYYRNHGTQDGYTPIIDREHLKTAITDCEHKDLLREFLVQTDGIQSFVSDLIDSDDDEYVEEWYEEMLLSRYPDIPSKAAKALADEPDERAKDSLLQTQWKDQAEVVPNAIEALVQLGGDDVRDALVEILDFSNKARIREAAAEGLASFEGLEVREALQETRDDPEEEDRVRQAARNTLQSIGE